MHLLGKSVVLLATQAIAVIASRSLDKRGSSLPFDFANHPYIPQQPEGVRSPCPALNTLANHGYLPRDGMNITKQDIITAFSDGWGVGETIIATPIVNAFAVCEFVNGEGACPTSFDLNVLNTPETFEHDHSMSRQDYFMNWAVQPNGEPNPLDNHTFNRTIFGTTLEVLLGKSTMTVSDAQEVHLNRVHLAYINDPANTFKESELTMLTEIGFVFAIMRNFKSARNGIPKQQPNNDKDQTVQVDFWSYWWCKFSRRCEPMFKNNRLTILLAKEEFPVELGWRKPVPDVQNDFVTKILNSVFSASVTSTPSPLPPDIFSTPTTVPINAGPTKRDAGATTSSTSVSNPTTTPTRGCTVVAPSGMPDLVKGTHTYHHSVCSQVTSSIGLGPEPLAPYQATYNSSYISKHKQALSTYKSKFVMAAESIVSSSAVASSQASSTTA